MAAVNHVLLRCIKMGFRRRSRRAGLGPAPPGAARIAPVHPDSSAAGFAAGRHAKIQWHFRESGLRLSADPSSSGFHSVVAIRALLVKIYEHRYIKVFSFRATKKMFFKYFLDINLS
jgi:hypothetical protein